MHDNVWIENYISFQKNNEKYVQNIVLSGEDKNNYVLNNNRMVDFYINKEDDHPIFTKLLNHLSVEVLQTIYDDADGMSLFDDCGRDCGCKQQEGV